MDAKQLFEILVRENSRMLTAFIRSAVSDSALADDIWQETMLIAWRRLDDYDMSRPFAPWLRGIAHRTIQAKRRQSSRWVLVDDDESLAYLSSRFDELQRLQGDTLDEKLDALRDCVAHLPEQERLCIELRYVESMMPAELSQKLGTALETIKKRLVRGKQRLMQCMQGKLAALESGGI